MAADSLQSFQLGAQLLLLKLLEDSQSTEAG
jgi:hypothetical protein